MSAKTKHPKKSNRKGVWVRARVCANTGNTAMLETTSDRLMTLERGHSPQALDLFRDEFLAKLPVGRVMNIYEFADGTCQTEFGRI
jgi:hypothetical protein